ncbi:DEAD/DEAH box helicase [Natroniella acetigena]|uniref:UvrD-helicase domain-containing protein n=1 Tax=Natroniella acetigena TaxID=52004 RepID=UPI00200A52F8|nr:DEAD/DEAH box helicase [Natroniella acetigena]MCK8826590.1 DEAD/DEAH box helicase [Natroniella acetigena]
MEQGIVLAHSFFDSFDRLSRQARKRIRKKLNQFAEEEKTNSFKIHKLKRQKCDESFCSARISDDLRMILSQQGDKYILLYVDWHDDAYDWAENKYLETTNFGAVYMYDEDVDFRANDYEQKKDPNQLYDNRASLLEKQEVKAKQLSKLGIPEVHADSLVKIKEEDRFLSFISVFNEEVQEGLLDIVAGDKSITQVYNELQAREESYDSIEEALEHQDSKRRFYAVEDLDELDLILEEDMEAWRLFLHPQQEELITKNYNGPALIEGGPGTGKTVVGIHRAVYLADKIYPAWAGNKILLATFSKKLACYLEEKVEKLARQKGIENNIEVYGVDSLIYKLLAENDLRQGRIGLEEIEELMEDIYLELELDKPFQFYKTEYKEVIQRYQVRSLEQYLEVDRIGRGSPLQPATRCKVWQFFERVLEQKEERNLVDFDDQAFRLLDALESNELEPSYDSIIIDEAQDLSPVKLKILKNLVKREENNLLLLSDKNQRIYQLGSWKGDAGVNIVGRTNYLTLNYRTTQQIKRYAEQQFSYSQLNTDYLVGYKSLFHGPEPELKEFDAENEQYRYIVERIKELLARGIGPYEICVMTPSSDDFTRLVDILNYEGIEATILQKAIYPQEGNGIGISTLHGSKGLEFRTVIVVNYSQIKDKVVGKLPDEKYVKNKLKQVDCLKYVACTRAREELVITKVN